MPLPPLGPIATPRLTLRDVAAADLADLMEVNGDQEVTRFLPYETWRSDADAAAWLERMTALVAQGSARQLVVARAGDGKVIGTVLLFRFDEGSARVELGYVLGRAHWRQGYASEALRAVVSRIVELGVRRVEAEVDPANAASNRLLAGLGFRLEGFLRERWVAKGVARGVNVYGLLAREWAAPA